MLHGLVKINLMSNLQVIIVRGEVGGRKYSANKINFFEIEFSTSGTPYQTKQSLPVHSIDLNHY